MLAATIPACGSGSPKTAAGDEIFSVLDEAVLEVSLRAPDVRAELRRFTAEQPFYFSRERAPSAFERCQASTRILGVLPPLLGIRVRALLDEAEGNALLSKHKPNTWIELEVRDEMEDAEPFQLRLLRAEPGGRVLAHRPGERLVFEVDRAILALLEQSCQG